MTKETIQPNTLRQIVSPLGVHQIQREDLRAQIAADEKSEAAHTNNILMAIAISLPNIQLSKFTNDLVNAILTGENIEEILDRHPEIVDKPIQELVGDQNIDMSQLNLLLPGQQVIFPSASSALEIPVIEGTTDEEDNEEPSMQQIKNTLFNNHPVIKSFIDDSKRQILDEDKTQPWYRLTDLTTLIVDRNGMKPENQSSVRTIVAIWWNKWKDTTARKPEEQRVKNKAIIAPQDEILRFLYHVRTYESGSTYRITKAPAQEYVKKKAQLTDFE